MNTFWQINVMDSFAKATGEKLFLELGAKATKVDVKEALNRMYGFPKEVLAIKQIDEETYKKNNKVMK